MIRLNISDIRDNVVEAVNKAADAELLDEASVTELVTTIIKAVLDKLYNIAMNMYRKVQELYRSAKDKVGRFSRSVYNDIMHRSNTRQSGNTWNKMVADMARRRAESEGYDSYFELYKWDDRYIDSLPDKMEKFDSLHMTANGKSISANVDSLIKFLQESLVSNHFDIDILKHYEDEIESEFSRIFQTRSNRPRVEDVLYRAGKSEKLRITISPRLVEDMIRSIETQPDVLYNISVQYKNLANEYRAAERVVDSIKASSSENAGKVRAFVNMIQSILTSKHAAFNTVQSAHVKIVSTRSSEYMQQILAYVNS